MVFTVELKEPMNGVHEVEIFLDEEGLDLILDRLKLLKNKKDHTHFMTPEWAGNELTVSKQGEENMLVHHLRIQKL